VCEAIMEPKYFKVNKRNNAYDAVSLLGSGEGRPRASRAMALGVQLIPPRCGYCIISSPAQLANLLH
jgi:hypothetical protein